MIRSKILKKPVTGAKSSSSRGWIPVGFIPPIGTVEWGIPEVMLACMCVLSACLILFGLYRELYFIHKVTKISDNMSALPTILDKLSGTITRLAEETMRNVTVESREHSEICREIEKTQDQITRTQDQVTRAHDLISNMHIRVTELITAARENRKIFLSQINGGKVDKMNQGEIDNG
jgi:hypothetical protein